MKEKVVKKLVMECPICDKKHEVEIRVRLAIITIKGVNVNYEETYYYCVNANEDENEFTPAKVEDVNLLNARNAYRIKAGLLTSDEIVKIRESYGLSQVDLAKLLNWGEATVSRYESKAIQDEAYDNILRTIRDNPMQTYEFLIKNKAKFNPLKFLSIKANILKNLDVYGKEFLKRQVLEIEYLPYSEMSDMNGNKLLDIDKLECMITYFAEKINNLYKVRLMKLLWYADAYAYKTYGAAMSGLVYCHEKMGALPIAHRKILELENVVVHEEMDDSENIKYRILPNDTLDLSALTHDDIKILDMVVNKFIYFNANEIAEYMHKEKAYLETKDKEIIPFSLAKEVSYI